MPKVSIIVPVYNTEKYLKKCLNSLVNQTLDDIEIIVVNDGATDNSQKIIDEFKNNYPDKINALKKENGGLSDSRNFGLNKASGEYIGFVDSDDYIEENMYEELYNLAIKNNLDIAECDFIWEYPKKSKNDFGSSYLKKSDFFTNGRVMAWNKIYRTSIMKENNIEFPFGLRYEDIEFFYKLVPFIKKHQNINKSLYHYIQRDTSIANTQNEKNADIFLILNNILNYYKKNNLFNEYQSELEYLFLRLLLGSSFLRIAKIKNKKIKNNLLNKTLFELASNFPNWKNNKYFKKNSKKNYYYKSINKFTFKIYSFLFKN